jgi:HK97 family phage major capsid protein
MCPPRLAIERKELLCPGSLGGLHGRETTTMDTGLADLFRDVKTASENIATAETRTTRSIAELRKSSLDLESKYDGLESSVNDLWKRVQRPGAEGFNGDVDERKDAIGHCVVKDNLTVPRVEGNASVYVPTSSEIDDAVLARKAFRNYFRHGDVNRLDLVERKSLSSFAFGNVGWIVSPQMSNQVLSCLVDPTDLAGLVNHVPISGGSIKFPIDNARLDTADWACNASCFANNPLPDLQNGLGELEIKAESLRFVACAGNDLLADASFPIE